MLYYLPPIANDRKMSFLSVVPASVSTFVCRGILGFCMCMGEVEAVWRWLVTWYLVNRWYKGQEVVYPFLSPDKNTEPPCPPPKPSRGPPRRVRDRLWWNLPHETRLPRCCDVRVSNMCGRVCTDAGGRKCLCGGPKVVAAWEGRPVCCNCGCYA